MRKFIQSFLSSGALISLGEGRLLVGFGNVNWESAPDLKRGAFYFPDFFLKSSYPWANFEVSFEISNASLLEELSLLDGRAFDGEFSELEREGFKAEFETFQDSDLKKVVPYMMRSSKERFSEQNLIESLKNILTRDGFIYGFWNNERGMLGVTPELLFKASDGILDTVALAGTKGLHASDEDFFNDPKERAEHSLVIEGITESLGAVEVGETHLINTGTLTHLQTRIRKKIDESNALSYIEKLHPTPALGGFPKQDAWKLLKDFAKRLPRGRFGAPVGALRAGGSDMNFYVAIRGVQWREEGTFIYAGCGVVKESKFENEFLEIDRKLNSIIKMLGFNHALA